MRWLARQVGGDAVWPPPAPGRGRGDPGLPCRHPLPSGQRPAAAALIAIRRRHAAIAVLFAGMLSLYLPWLAISRITFIYHFFPVVPFVLPAEAYVLKTTSRRLPRGRWVTGALLAAAVALQSARVSTSAA